MAVGDVAPTRSPRPILHQVHPIVPGDVHLCLLCLDVLRAVVLGDKARLLDAVKGNLPRFEKLLAGSMSDARKEKRHQRVEEGVGIAATPLLGTVVLPADVWAWLQARSAAKAGVNAAEY